MTSRFFLGKHLEPPAWAYARMARGPIFRRIYRRLAADLAAALPLEAALLDVGTGPGYLMRHLARLRPDLRLVGLDADHRMLRHGRTGEGTAAAPHPCRWLAGRVESLPFPPQSFDLTLSTFSLHAWPKPVAGVREIMRVIKPEGRAWIYEMNRETAAADLRRFARAEKLPFPVVYLGFRLLSLHHAMRAGEFAAIMEQAGVSRWHLTQAHQIFWQVELQSGA